MVSLSLFSLKGYLTRTDENIAQLQAEIKQKDDEITFLRSMLASLSEKVEHLEKSAVGKIGKTNLIQCQFFCVVIIRKT